MDRSEIRDTLYRMLMNNGVTHSISESMKFTDFMDIDSLDLIATIVDVEEYFDITITDECADTIVTVKQAIDSISALLENQSRV